MCCRVRTRTRIRSSYTPPADAADAAAVADDCVNDNNSCVCTRAYTRRSVCVCVFVGRSALAKSKRSNALASAAAVAATQQQHRHKHPHTGGTLKFRAVRLRHKEVLAGETRGRGIFPPTRPPTNPNNLPRSSTVVYSRHRRQTIKEWIDPVVDFNFHLCAPSSRPRLPSKQ